MGKVYVVVKGASKSTPDIVAAFRSEGDAEQSASKHRSETTKAWVEEVNYYE